MRHLAMLKCLSTPFVASSMVDTRQERCYSSLNEKNETRRILVPNY